MRPRILHERYFALLRRDAVACGNGNLEYDFVICCFAAGRNGYGRPTARESTFRRERNATLSARHKIHFFLDVSFNVRNVLGADGLHGRIDEILCE